MGRHEIREPQEHHRQAQHSRLGRGALGVALNRKAHRALSEDSRPNTTVQGSRRGRHRPESVEASEWQQLGEGVKSSAENEKRVKDLFDTGVRRLSHTRKYHPRIMERLPSARMTPVWDDRSEQLGASLGENDNYGRYISLRSLDDDVTTFHELAHRVFRLGKKVTSRDEQTGRIVHSEYNYSLFDEPLAEELAQDIASISGTENTSGVDYAYEPHAQVLSKTLQISRMSYRELTAIASGGDPDTNYEIFRSIAWERAGWDVVGFVDGSYWSHLDASSSDTASHDAAVLINDALTPYVPIPASGYTQAA